MRKILILFAFVLFFVGINTDYFSHLQQKQSFFSIQTEQKETDSSPFINTSQYFIENIQITPITCEKPSFSLRLHSTFRLLVVIISFKETCIRQFFKNKFTTSEIISNICLVKRLHAGYYTYGLGKIRL